MAIRIMLGASTAMVRSALLATLGECDDFELVDQDASGRAPPMVDVLVLQQRLMRDFPAALEAIADGSHIGVVAIDDDGEAGDLYRIYRSGWEFSPGGQNRLPDAIRVVARAG